MPSRSATINWWLLAVALIAAVPRLYLGATQFIEYDGYWHVFIASQDDWHQFYKEYQSNFHPPLFYLLLKVAMWFGRTPLVYRAISLLTGVAAVFVTGKIAERLSLHHYTAVVAALAYGLALPSIIISCEVRSYMLNMFFILLSFYYFLDVLDEPGGAPIKSRALFAVYAVLAGYSHYGAFLYICACLATSVLLDVSLFRRNLFKRLAQDLITFGVIAAALAYVYLTHGQPHAVVAEHLRGYYFQPAQETLWAFLTRNSHQLLNLFSPLPVTGEITFYLVFATLILASAWLVYLIRRLTQAENVQAAATVLTSIVLLAAMATGGVLGKYPYGGELRQQFFLFPFAILCGCILLDRIAAALRPSLSTGLLGSVSAVTIIAWSFAFAQYPKVRTELGTAQMNRFRIDFPAPPAIYVDEFNLINFFHSLPRLALAFCRTLPGRSRDRHLPCESRDREFSAAARFFAVEPGLGGSGIVPRSGRLYTRSAPALADNFLHAPEAGGGRDPARARSRASRTHRGCQRIPVRAQATSGGRESIRTSRGRQVRNRNRLGSEMRQVRRHELEHHLRRQLGARGIRAGVGCNANLHQRLHGGSALLFRRHGAALLVHEGLQSRASPPSSLMACQKACRPLQSTIEWQSSSLFAGLQPGRAHG